MNLSIWQISMVGVVGLLGVGFYGLLACRNLVKLVIAMQILVKGALLALMAARCLAVAYPLFSRNPYWGYRSS